MRVPRSSTGLPGLACLIAALWLPTAAFAQQAGQHDEDSRAREADQAAPAPSGPAARAATSATPGLRAVTADEAKVLAEGIARLVDQSSEGLKVTRNPITGATSVDLDDRFQNVSLARVGVDGRPSVRCVSSVQEAKQFLGAPAAPTRPSGSTKASQARPSAVLKPAGASRPAPLTSPLPLEEK